MPRRSVHTDVMETNNGGDMQREENLNELQAMHPDSIPAEAILLGHLKPQLNRAKLKSTLTEQQGTILEVHYGKSC